MKERKNYRAHHALIASCLCLSAVQAVAQSSADFPARPITIISPYAPGGTDIPIRLYTDSISADNPQWRFVMDYKQGAGGAIALGHLKKSAPDGHTLAVTSTTLLLTSVMEVKPPFEEKDFAPVYQISGTPNIFVVNAALPIKSMPELIAYAKANPGKLNWPMVGSAGIQRLVAEYVQDLFGVKFALIPYRGLGPIGVAMMSGEVDVTLQSPLSVAASIKAGKARALATTGRAGFAFPQFPDIKTVTESGVPPFEHFSWVSLHAPAGTSLPIRTSINRMFNDVLRKPEMVSRLHAVGTTPGGGNVQDFEKFLDMQRDRWTKTATRLGIKLSPD